jgi:hypothetical protein
MMARGLLIIPLLLLPSLLPLLLLLPQVLQ